MSDYPIESGYDPYVKPDILPQHSDYVACGNCGQMIGKTQTYTTIKNLRFGNQEFYHESYMGCYEATQRRNSRPRVILNRFTKGLNEILFAETGNGDYADIEDAFQIE